MINIMKAFVCLSLKSNQSNFVVSNINHDYLNIVIVHINPLSFSGQHVDIEPALISSPEYMLKIGPGNCSVSDCPYNYSLYAEAGGAHVVYITEDIINLYTVVRPNTVNILWQLPQFFVITVGEVLFSVTGLEFSYSQASPNMKSVLQVKFNKVFNKFKLLPYFQALFCILQIGC